MDFPSEWFEPEVREGFFVNGMMKRAWAAQLDVLAEIDRVCTRHGLQWFADCGTLLGAVRHGGFIPWDDDIDICMLRDDYKKFQEVAEAELPKDFVVMDYRKEGFHELLTYVGSGSSIRMDEEYFSKFHGFPFVAGIDIFPLDFASPDPEEEERRTELANLLQSAAGCVEKENPLSRETLSLLKQIESTLHCRLDHKKSLKVQLMDLTISLYDKYDRSTTDEIFLLPYWIDYHNHRYRLEWFGSSVLLPFETGTIRVPAMYEAVLRTEYGANYMTPVVGGAVHGYPFYSAQETVLAEHLGASYPFRYFWDPQDPGRPEVEPNCADVLFFPYKADYWPSMRFAYEEELKDPSQQVRVIPIPWFDKNPDGSLGEGHYEAERFMKEVPVESFQSYDYDHRRPLKIYIQAPFDDKDYTISVHPVFYARNLKNMTKELIYIPCFLPKEEILRSVPGQISLSHLVTLPGVAQADKVLLPSEELCSIYLEALIKWAGEDTKGIWEKKILCRAPAPAEPEETKPGKKTILYVTGISSLFEHREKALSKIRRVLDLFREEKERISLLWAPSFRLDDPALAKGPLANGLADLVEEYKKDPVGLLDESGSPGEAALACDAYYGDPGPLVIKFREAGKPVMLQNVEV